MKKFSKRLTVFFTLLKIIHEILISSVDVRIDQFCSTTCGKFYL